jgi:hypothetical protein
VVRRGLIVVVVAAAAFAALAFLRPSDDGAPVAVVGHTGIVQLTSTTAAPVAAAPAPTPTTAPQPKVVANRSSTVVHADAGSVTVVSSGEAVASTGGNTVLGTPDGASVVNGPVTAVGNSSEVRISRP